MQGLGTSIKAKVIAAHMNKNAFLQVAPKAKQAMRFPLEIKLISRQPYFIVQCHNKILTDTYNCDEKTIHCSTFLERLQTHNLGNQTKNGSFICFCQG